MAAEMEMLLCCAVGGARRIETFLPLDHFQVRLGLIASFVQIIVRPPHNTLRFSFAIVLEPF